MNVYALQCSTRLIYKRIEIAQMYIVFPFKKTSAHESVCINSSAHRSEHTQHAAVPPKKNGLFVQIQIINKILSEIF